MSKSNLGFTTPCSTRPARAPPAPLSWTMPGNGHALIRERKGTLRTMPSTSDTQCQRGNFVVSTITRMSTMKTLPGHGLETV